MSSGLLMLAWLESGEKAIASALVRFVIFKVYGREEPLLVRTVDHELSILEDDLRTAIRGRID